jgi:quinol monooxygenase YgiN
MIHVIATIHTAPGRRDELIAAFRELIPVVRAETGCVEYGTAVDLLTPIVAQAPIVADAVTVVEKWDSVPALQAHLVAPHMLSHRERVKNIVTRVEIRILEPV